MFKLIQDDDSHWYVIPVELEPQFEAWQKHVENYEETDYSGPDFNEYAIGGSPSLVIFPSYEIKND